MDASIKESVKASDKEAQYDEKAKKLLGHKIILAYILVNTVEEFQGMNPEDVVKYIEGEPYISTVPLDPGMTNTKERKEGSIKETETPEQIRGLANDNSTEYRKRATDPENPVFSGFSLYSENLSDTFKTHENVPVTNR